MITPDPLTGMEILKIIFWSVYGCVGLMLFLVSLEEGEVFPVFLIWAFVLANIFWWEYIIPICIIIAVLIGVVALCFPSNRHAIKVMWLENKIEREKKKQEYFKELSDMRDELIRVKEYPYTEATKEELKIFDRMLKKKNEKNNT